MYHRAAQKNERGMQFIIQRVVWPHIEHSCAVRLTSVAPLCFFSGCHHIGTSPVCHCPCCKQETTSCSVKEVMKRKSSYGRGTLVVANEFVVVALTLSRGEGQAIKIR